MVSIGRLQMRLPAGFEHRAAGISRALGEYLAETRLNGPYSTDRLALGTLHVASHATDRQIAEMVARQILASLGRLG